MNRYEPYGWEDRTNYYELCESYETVIKCSQEWLEKLQKQLYGIEEFDEVKLEDFVEELTHILGVEFVGKKRDIKVMGKEIKSGCTK